MAKKGGASKAVRLLREGVKKGCAAAVRFLLRSYSYPFFGIPNGLLKEELCPKEIYPAKQVLLQPPHCVDSPLHWRFRHSLEHCYPSAGLFSISEAFATSLGGNLTKKGELITTYLTPLDGKPFKRHDLFHFSTKRFFPRIYKSSKPALTLTAGWQDAFYHWMYEVLPQIHLAEMGEVQLESIYIAAHLPFQKESLELMGLSKEQIINTKDYDALYTPKLTVTSAPSQPTPWSCKFLREKFLPHLTSRPHKRLYVTRADASRRRVINEEEVFSLLEKWGFEKVALSALSFKEQMEQFAAAKMVVGPHGAGFSHLVFCDPKTPVLEFFHPGYVNLCYWQLSNVMGHPYYYLMGEEDRYPDFFDPHLDLDMTIDLKKLEKTLQIMS